MNLSDDHRPLPPGPPRRVRLTFIRTDKPQLTSEPVERGEGRVPVFLKESVYPDDLSLPFDLRHAYESARYLLCASRSIIQESIQANGLAGDQRTQAVEKLRSLALDLRSKIKDCQCKIQAVVPAIREVNRERIQSDPPRFSDWTNAYDAVMDVAGLVIEEIWDCSYRDEGGYSAEELYSWSLPAKFVLRGLPSIAQDLEWLIGSRLLDKLGERLPKEAVRTADARQAPPRPLAGGPEPTPAPVQPVTAQGSPLTFPTAGRPESTPAQAAGQSSAPHSPTDLRLRWHGTRQSWATQSNSYMKRPRKNRAAKNNSPSCWLRQRPEPMRGGPNKSNGPQQTGPRIGLDSSASLPGLSSAGSTLSATRS